MASSGEQANQAWQPAQQAGMRHQQPLLPSMGAFHNPTPGSLLAQVQHLSIPFPSLVACSPRVDHCHMLVPLALPALKLCSFVLWQYR